MFCHFGQKFENSKWWPYVESSAGRSLGFSLSMFVSDICNQTSDISDYGVEV